MGQLQHRAAPVGLLAERAGDLPNLRALFIGDIIGDECEVSWLQSDDPAPLLAAYPALTHLGLRDAHAADELMAAVADAPVVARLEHLDLSMGTLGDDGVRRLLAGQPLTHLASLNLRHHFVSPELAARVVAELPGVAVDVAEPQAEFDGTRYVAVGE